ncbi:uncharacterized protein LOC110020239 [Phalaenopsis equestris]|uniref:uncharacterized protein LOC110020239 n=1 Tax=Phalaenopsis equestris TaxID=78828 RepID=UPI0009E4BE28|nr:uncharacterized protein LOC110020239 [Phalaenopsis equestris]
MEKGGSFGSADELRERRKKKGALPLAVFLSFNDRDVNPECPDARNPYHKCGWHCLDKIPSVNKLLDGERSGGSSSDWEKMSERKGVNPSCPNASNSYHKCSEYCSEKITGKIHDAFIEPGKDKGVLITGDESDVNPNCKHASNPYHKCNKFCFANSPVIRNDVMKAKEQKLVGTANRAVNPACKYASNPYHVCAEYCFREAPERALPGQAINPKSTKERKKMVKHTERSGVNPGCKYASNPFHKCSEYCFQNVADRYISDGVTKSKEGKITISGADRRDGKPRCKNASNPYHKCTDDCFQEIFRDNPAVERISPPINEKNDGRPKERKADHSIIERSLDVEANGMEASNSSHKFTDSSNEVSIHAETNESESVFTKDEKEAGMIELLDSQPLRIDASELFKEWAKYCSLKAQEDSEVKTEKTGQR